MTKWIGYGPLRPIICLWDCFKKDCRLRDGGCDCGLPERMKEREERVNAEYLKNIMIEESR